MSTTQIDRNFSQVHKQKSRADLYPIGQLASQLWDENGCGCLLVDGNSSD